MGGKRILIADDDRLILSTLGQGLRDAGYEVFEATDGKAAVNLCESEHPDLAILDIRMPGMSGVEAAHLIRQDTETPLMFLSAYSDKEVVELAVEEGALGYLVKPVDIPQLIPSIEAALARAAELSTLRNTEHSLNSALKAGREVSMAVGLIMERYRLTRSMAFDVLRRYAREHRYKISKAAEDLLSASDALSISRDILAKAVNYKAD